MCIRDSVKLVRSIEEVGKSAIECDVTNYSSVKIAAREIKKIKKPLKAFINAAGVASMNMAVTADKSTVQKLIQTNLVGTIYCCQLFAPLMLRQNYGSFINFSTIAVTLALKGESIYAASKAGVEAFSRSFAREMADFNVRVNCIAPGPVIKNLRQNEDQFKKQYMNTLLKAKVNPLELCEAAQFFFNTSSVTGEVISLDSGQRITWRKRNIKVNE